MERFGTKYGGWYIPKSFNIDHTTICYSAGAGEDISFDVELVERYRCKINIVDPTPRAIQHFENLKNATLHNIQFSINNSSTEFYSIKASSMDLIKFIPYGISSSNSRQKFYLPKNSAHVSCSTVNLQNTSEYFEANCFTLYELMKANNDEKINLLKIDIEGAEYSVIENIVQENLLPDLLLVEFDELHTPKDASANSRVRNCIDMILDSGMKCVYVDGCNAVFLKNNGN